ncbi:hypothetical protein U1Q18_026655 [Sarracenia purpurea var. burkii]
MYGRNWPGLVEEISCYDSSSPEGAQSSAAFKAEGEQSAVASKNIVSERNRRKKLNERLIALRAVVPNISKMDKASIIKDAIEYIQELHEQERRIQAEIVELESRKFNRNSTDFEFDAGDMRPPAVLRSKKTKVDQSYDSGGLRSSPIEDLELSVCDMGEKKLVVSLTCCRRRDTIIKLCEVFESLKLKVITANITAFSGRILKTLFIHELGTLFDESTQADEKEKDDLKTEIENAIAALNDPESPMSM